MHRNLQRLCDPDARDNMGRRYNQLQRHYTWSVQHTKTTSWRTFITELGSQGPYGIAYKVIRKCIAVDEVMADLRTQSGHTITLDESARYLLNALIADAPRSSEVQSGCRNLNLDAHMTRCWTKDEVLRVVRTLPSKAPGNDRVESVMLRQLATSPTYIRCLHTLYNGCLTYSCFPTIWKHGLIRAILKNTTKDPSDPKSYRPICLLPFLGKVLEKLVKIGSTTSSCSLIMHPSISTVFAKAVPSKMLSMRFVVG